MSDRSQKVRRPVVAQRLLRIFVHNICHLSHSFFQQFTRKITNQIKIESEFRVVDIYRAPKNIDRSITVQIRYLVLMGFRKMFSVHGNVKDCDVVDTA